MIHPLKPLYCKYCVLSQSTTHRRADTPLCTCVHTRQYRAEYDRMNEVAQTVQGSLLDGNG